MKTDNYWTTDDKVYLYKKCAEFATSRIFDSRALAEDVRSYAFEKALASLDHIRPQAGTTKEKCLECIAFSRVLDAIKHINTRKVAMVVNAVPVSPTDYIPDEDDASDESEGIALELPEIPLWKSEYYRERRQLRGLEYKIAIRLENGLSLERIQWELGLSRGMLKRKVKNLRVRFAQCFRGYKAYCKNCR